MKKNIYNTLYIYILLLYHLDHHHPQPSPESGLRLRPFLTHSARNPQLEIIFNFQFQWLDAYNRPDVFDICRTKFIFILCLTPWSKSSRILSFSSTPSCCSSSLFRISSKRISHAIERVMICCLYCWLPNTELTQLPSALKITAPFSIICCSSE